jgi:dTMP kinase
MHPDPKPYARTGFFLTFEGLDGAGKTTQIQRLKALLEKDGIPVLVTRQPGGTEFGDKIRALLLDSKSDGIAPRAELAMMFADRAQAIQQVIAPALQIPQVVICDRFTDSTEAYQGGGRELGSEIVRELHRLICDDLQPDLTILLLPDLETSLYRARRQNVAHGANGSNDEGRFEQERDSFFHRVQAKYLEIAERDHQRVKMIKGNLSVTDVRARIETEVMRRLRLHGLCGVANG